MFTYGHLDRDVRLVRFKQLPSDSGIPLLELELRHAFSDDDTHYNALSYVWGDLSKSTAAQIYVIGNVFTVSHNLHVALIQLYQNGIRSWLWVDAICINQLDLEEKSWQVAQMRTIFTRAECVYIWLGPGTHETDKAMEFASRVGPRAVDVGVLDLWFDLDLRDQVIHLVNERASSTEVRDRNNERNILAEGLADFIFDILHEPDLQISTTPNKITCIDRMSKNLLVHGISKLMQREYWQRIWVIQELSLAEEPVILCGDKVTPLDSFDATFYAISYSIQSGLRRVFPKTQNFVIGLPNNFYSSIPLITRRECRRTEPGRLSKILVQDGTPPGRPHYSATDARDIVFGLLGLITDDEALGLRVDYKMTLEGVFTALTRALMHRSSMLLLGPESDPEEDYVWRTIMLDNYDRYGRHNRIEAKLIDNEKTFIIRKIMRREPIVIEALTEAQKDFIRNGLIHPNFLKSNFETLDQQFEFIVRQLPKNIGSINRGRTLFKTTKGMFGLGHVAVRPADVVCLLWGQQSPVVLRPRNDGGNGGFTFVGDAYVDGIMYGEFLKTAPAHENFEIY